MAPVVNPTRVERSVPLKAVVSQINYNLFDIELGNQQQQFAYLQAKDLVDTVSGVMVTHDVALWNGNDTSLSSPTTTQYMGVINQIAGGGNTVTIGTSASIVDGLKSTVAQMVANNGYHVRPTAIYANPVLLDLIDREMKTEFNVVLNTDQITGASHAAHLPAGSARFPCPAVCRREVRRAGSKGRELCALPGACRPVAHPITESDSGQQTDLVCCSL